MSGNCQAFILGSPRSGSTFLSVQLRRYSALHIPPETEFFYLADRFGTLHDGSLTDVERRCFLEQYSGRRVARFLNLTEEFLARWGEPDGGYRQLFERLMDHLCAGTEHDGWVEQTPHHLALAGKIAQVMPEARFIILVRDPRAVVSSRVRHPNWSDSAYVAAKHVKADLERIRSLSMEMDAERFIVVRYEELITETERVIAGVLAFLGVPLRMPIDDLATGTLPDMEFYKQQWMKKSLEAADSSRLQAWKVELLTQERKVCQALLGPLLATFDYEADDVDTGRVRYLLPLLEMKRLAGRIGKRGRRLLFGD